MVLHGRSITAQRQFAYMDTYIVKFLSRAHTYTRPEPARTDDCEPKNIFGRFIIEHVYTVETEFRFCTSVEKYALTHKIGILFFFGPACSAQLGLVYMRLGWLG